MTPAEIVERVRASGQHPVSCFGPLRRDGTRQCVFGGTVTNADYLWVLAHTQKASRAGEVETGQARARRRAEDAANRY